MSSLTFTQSVLRTVVAKICNDVGWHSAHISTLNVLSDLLNHYLRRLSMMAIDAANHAGRHEPTMEDMNLAFKLMAIDMNQLQDYLLNVESSPLEFDLPVYPLPNRPNRIFDQCDLSEERSEYYDEWLPSLNYTKMKSLEYGSSQNSKYLISTDENHINSNHKNDQNSSNKIIKKTEKTTSDETPNGDDIKANKNEEIEIETPDEDQKTKLVFKFSLGKSLEENQSNMNQDATIQNANDSSNKVTLFQSSSSNDLVNHLMSSKAYLRFLQSSSITNLENQETRKKLRFPDIQRLPNDHKSRENSPEPEPEHTDSINNNPLNTIGNNLDLEDLNMKKIKKMFKKKNKQKPNNNTDDFSDIFGEAIKPNITVKEIGTKGKERIKKEGGEKILKPKKPKIDKPPLSIKVTGFGLSNEDNNNKPVTIDGPNEQENNLNATVVDKNPETPLNTIKRQYKRKEKQPKENVERKSRKPKKLEQPKQQLTKDPNNLGFVPSPISDTSFPPSLFSPKNISNKKGIQDLFNENEAAKTLVLMSESNDTTLKDRDTSSKQNEDSQFSCGSENESLTDICDSNSKPVGSKKLVGRPTTKRNKNVYSKKIVKSAEVIESSDDSSSDDVDVDQNPVSLLVPSEFPENIEEENTPANKRKRRNSNSSLSSVSSIHSSKSSRSAALIEPVSFDPGMEINKPCKSSIEEQHKSKKNGDEKSKESSKHKKNKKHSKNKHRHGDEKQHKKHKKTKDKERDKDSLKIKDREKSYKPKLSIKFGQVPNLDPMRLESSNSPKHQMIQESEEASFINFKDSNFINIMKNDTKKKRPAKTKKTEPEARNELVFIKDATIKTKESKIKKNQIINVATSLLDDSVASTPTVTSKPKSKEIPIEKESKKIKEKEVEIAKMNEESPSSSLSKSKKEKTKDSKKEKEPLHINKKVENQSCILIRETINVESIDDKLWICPKCSKPDDGTPMICCDTCEAWYHYYCVGIQNDPSPDEPWFCSHCYEKQKKKLEKFQKKKEKHKAKHEDNSVTITPIPPTDIGGDLTPSVSIFPIAGMNPQGHNMMISTPATTTPGYKPTGRPRGRPRKDSSTNNNSLKQPSVTITPIGPSTSAATNFSQKFEPNFLFEQQAYPTPINLMINPVNVNEKPTPKKIKEICPKCQIVEELSVNMIGCDNCDQWYHWPCVGINTAPSPDSSWFCAKCSKKKSSKRLWDEIDSDSGEEHIMCDRNTKSMSSIQTPSKTRRIISNMQKEGAKDHTDGHSDSGNWLCGTCKQATTFEPNPRWIACDECDQWYHFICEKILDEPGEDELWFCRHCIKKQRNIENQIHNKSKRKM